MDLVRFAGGREGAAWGPGLEPHSLVCRALLSLLGLLVGEELPVAQTPQRLEVEQMSSSWDRPGGVR